MSEIEDSSLQQAPQPQDVVQQGQQLSTPLSATTPQQPTVNAAGESLQCQWQDCGERSPTAEALYVSDLDFDVSLSHC